MTAPGFDPLVTQRLRVRTLEPGDAEAVHRLVNDWEVAKNLARVPFPYSRALAEEWIGSTAAQRRSGAGWHLCIEAGGTLIGNVGLALDRDRRRAELGYWIGRAFWGQGYAVEAATALLGWARGALALDGVYASALVEHARSQAVLRRLGFQEAGTGTAAFLARGRSLPVKRYVLPARRFEALRPAGLAQGTASAPASPRAATAVGSGGLPSGEGPLGPDVARPGPGGAVAEARAGPRSPARRARTPAKSATEAPRILLVVACALVDPDGRVLLAQRPEGKPMAGLWEFPGGKVAPDETPEDALIRELAEELGVGVAASCLAPFAFASHPLEGRHLLMPLYVCRRWEGTPAAREGQALAWVRPARMRDYAMPPADLPLVAQLRDLL